MHEASAQGWCAGMTQRDGMRREVGGAIRMGNTCKSMADLWQKPLQYCKVIGLQLIKKRKKERKLWYTDTMEYYSAIKKNTFESVLMRWMKLEPVIQSEVSQKKNTNNSILTHIYEI